MTVSWLPHQQSVLAPPEELTTTEWSEKYIIIPSLLSPIHHGPYDSSITPYLREVQDVMGDEQHQFIDIMKSVQCGGSQATRNALLHWLSRRPYPVLLVYPDEDSAKDNLNRKILPAIKACPITAAFISGRKWDVKRRRIALTITDIAAGWSGSPQSLASDPFGSVIFDEVDKFQPFAGKDADAISLGIRRTTTFQDKRKIIRLSTPTTPLGFISRAFEASPDKRDYHLPCPHCARMFLPSFRLLSYPGKTDDRGADAARIEETRCVRMGCPECGAEIADEQKPMMVRDGKWCSRGYDFDAHPDSDRVAFHIPGIISLIGPTWSQIVANFLRAYGDYAGLMDFFNNDLGEPFQDRMDAIKSTLFTEKRDKGHPEQVVPSWGAVVIASADSQKDHYWFTVRAWGRGGMSRLLAFGRAESLTDLYQRTVLARWPIEGTTKLLGTHCLLIDSGGTLIEGEDMSMTEKVYRFSKTDPAHIWPTKGRTTGLVPVQAANVTYKPPGYTAALQVQLRHVNVDYFKDVLSHSLKQEDPEIWQENVAVTDQYGKQMSSQHKVAVRKGNLIKWEWQKLSHGTPDHLWDASVLNLAGAYILETATFPEEKMLVQRRTPPKQAPLPQESTNRFRRKDGKPWVHRRKKRKRS